MLLAATVISSGAACRYGAEGKRFDDTLSREISHRNAARTIRGGDFSTPLRYGRNDGGRGRLFYNLRPLKGKRLTTFCASPALLQNVFAVHRRAIPQPSGTKAPSNLRTLRPIGPVNPKNLFHNLFPQPFYTTRNISRAPFFIIVKMSHFIHERRVYNKIKYSKS